MELTEYDIQYKPRRNINFQVLSYLLSELSSPPSKDNPHLWILFVDNSLNLKGCGTGIVLEGPEDLLISLKFELKASNNQAYYEALIFGMVLSLEVCASSLKAMSDSQLVANQVIGKYHIKEP